ncbi:hypothetical protein [Acinetobacter baumannii]|uniref:hypothetical protein n=1 Tax=Acinetobacter baumannii TaxID=470 RepID=UPI0034CE1D3A
MNSWIKFFLIPLLPIVIHTLLTAYFLTNTSQDNFTLNLLYILLGLILIVSSIYFMLKFAPKQPYLAASIYTLVLWFVLSYSVNFKVTGLIASITCALLAMVIYHFKNKNINQY